jgi:hypothetical protein
MQQMEQLKEMLALKVPEGAPCFVVCTPLITERLKYTCCFIFNHVLRADFRLTSATDEKTGENEFLINYSFREADGVFRVKPHTLLTDEAMLGRHPEAQFRGGQIYFFSNTENHTGLHFDIFSAVFYFISRHEEWQDFQPDRHGRFEAEASLLYKNQYHLKPVVDQWIMEFNLALRRVYPKLKFPLKKFRALSTIDVDNLFAYKGKGLLRNIGGAGKDLVRFDLRAVGERFMVMTGLRKDPFDVYGHLTDLCAETGIPLVFFFLMRHGTRYDRTIDPDRGVFEPVIKKLRQCRSFIGLHPSYHAFSNSGMTGGEARLLAGISGNTIRFSRQHYLRFDIRTTPQVLMDNGIFADFSMGFASSTGFRAGTSHPFYYYDFRHEKATSLLFVPFCVMDGVFTVYNKADPRSALVTVLAMAAEVKKTGGIFTFVFHERTFSNRLYRGFGTMYKNLILKLSELEKQ